MSNLICLAVIAAAALAGLAMWTYFHAVGASPPRWLREHRRLSKELGVARQVDITLDLDLIAHREILAAAEAHGFAVVRWAPAGSGGMVYSFERRVAYAAPCDLQINTLGRRAV